MRRALIDEARHVVGVVGNGDVPPADVRVVESLLGLRLAHAAEPSAVSGNVVRRERWSGWMPGKAEEGGVGDGLYGDDVLVGLVAVLAEGGATDGGHARGPSGGGGAEVGTATRRAAFPR